MLQFKNPSIISGCYNFIRLLIIIMFTKKRVKVHNGVNTTHYAYSTVGTYIMSIGLYIDLFAPLVSVSSMINCSVVQFCWLTLNDYHITY